MAQDIVASVAGLKNSIDGLSARIRATGERGMARLRESREMARIDSLIKTSSEIDASYGKIRKAKDLLRASREMRRDPDRWPSLGEYLRWEEATRRRNKKEFLREQEVSDTVRGILSPEVQHKYELEREYGRTGAERILAAEDRARRDKGRKAYEFDILSNSEKRLRTLTEKYGGGESGAQMAQDVIQRTQMENLARLYMSDYEAFIHDHSADFGGRAGADAAFRQKLLKDLPPFFKDSKLSTKQLIAIQKSLASIKSTPIIGRTLGKMIENPVAGISAMALAGAASVFNVSDKANKSVVSWKNAVNLYGLPNKRFYNAALLAGLSNPKEITELWGKLVVQYGDPDAVLPAFGRMFAGMGKREKTLAASSIPGLDPTTVAIIDILSGNLKPDKTRTTTALRTKIENTMDFGFRTGSTLGQFVQSLWLSLQGGAQARDASNFKYVAEGVEENFNEVIDDLKVDDATGAAESLDEAERQGDTTMNSNVRNNEVNVTMNVYTDNPKALSEKFYEIVNGDNRGLLATSGNYVLA